MAIVSIINYAIMFLWLFFQESVHICCVSEIQWMLFTRVDIFLELKCQENRPLRMTVIKRRLNCETNFSETQHKFGIVLFILKLVLLSLQYLREVISLENCSVILKGRKWNYFGQKSKLSPVLISSNLSLMWKNLFKSICSFAKICRE